MQKNNGSTRTIVNTPASAALPANFNATTLRIAQISQSRAQLAAFLLVRTTSTTITTINLATLWLTTKEIDQLMKFDKCFNYKKEEHTSRNCIRLNKPYSAVRVVLQKLELVENSASELGKA